MTDGCARIVFLYNICLVRSLICLYGILISLSVRVDVSDMCRCSEEGITYRFKTSLLNTHTLIDTHTLVQA